MKRKLGTSRSVRISLFIVLIASLFFIASVSAFGFNEPGFEDGYSNTTDQITSYTNASTFEGHKLSIIGNDDFLFNLTNLSKTKEFDTAWGGNETLDTTGLSEGSYRIINESGSDQMQIDVLNTNHDVVGRISTDAGNSLNDIQNPSIDVYWWLNSSKIDHGSSNAINISSSSPTQWNTGPQKEYVYRINTSIDNYWIGFSSKRHGEEVIASRGKYAKNQNTADTPRINDVSLSQRSNVSGQVTNETDDPVKGAVVKIKRLGSTGGLRTPYSAVPPIKTNWTNQNGFYNFTGLPSGTYQLDIVNDSIGLYNKSGFFHDVQIGSLYGTGNIPENETYALNVSSYTGTIKGTFAGKQTPDRRFGLLIANTSEARSFVHLEAGITPGESFTIKGIPNGTYGGLAARFIEPGLNNQSIQSKSIEGINVTDGGTYNLGRIGFPPRVYVTGNVSRKDNGNTVEDARVVISNMSQGTSSRSRTDSDGFYNVSIGNATSYNITVYPPDGTNLVENETRTTVEAPYSNTQNVTLKTGSTLDGWVKADGTPVEADLFIWNDSKQVWRNAETGANGSTGYYEVKGLPDGQYGIRAYPRLIKYSQNKTTVSVSGDTSQDIDVSTERYNLTVNVTNSTGQNIDAQIRVRSYQANIRQQNSTTDAITYTDLPGNTGYSIEVRPDGSSYSEERTRTYLTSNEAVDIEVAELQGITGYVVDSSNNDNPVEDALVYAYNYTEGSFESDETDADGVYQLNVKEADHTVSVYPPFDSNLASNTTSVTESEVSSDNEINISLSGGTTLNGSLLNASDKTQAAVDGWIGVWNASSDSYGYTNLEKGNFTIKGLQDVGHNVRIYVENDTYQSNTTTVSATALSWSRTNFTIQPTSSGRILVIEVLDSDDEPIEGASVYTESQEVQTDSEGLANLGRKAPDQTLSVRIEKDGYKSTIEAIDTKNKTDRFNATKNYQYENYTLENIQGNAFDVDVNVSRTNGQPVQEATITFRNSANNLSIGDSAVTDSEGEATIEGLIEGDYFVTVAATADNFNSTQITGLSDGTSQTTVSDIDDDFALTYEVSE